MPPLAGAPLCVPPMSNNYTFADIAHSSLPSELRSTRRSTALLV